MTVVCRNKDCFYNCRETCVKPIAIVISENNECLNYKDSPKKYEEE